MDEENFWLSSDWVGVVLTLVRARVMTQIHVMAVLRLVRVAAQVWVVVVLTSVKVTTRVGCKLFLDWLEHTFFSTIAMLATLLYLLYWFRGRVRVRLGVREPFVTLKGAN